MRIFAYLAAGLALAAPAPAMAGVTFSTSDDLVFDVVAPRAFTLPFHAANTYQLVGKNEIQYTDAVGSHVGRFNEVLTVVPSVGWNALARIHVERGSLIGVTDYGNFTAHTRVSTDGVTSCTLALTFRKKPGEKFYTIPAPQQGTTLYASEIHVVNTTCQISRTSN